MQLQEIRSRRVSEEIPATLLASRARINRTRLSFIERGHVQATTDELARLGAALDELVTARSRVRETAEEVGWPVQSLT